MAANQTGRRIAVVSNNSADCIHAYLSAHQLTTYVQLVIGRPEAVPERMKPHPYPVLAAIGELGAEPGECLLVGDSFSDIEAAQAAGVAVIGYANKPGKRERLTDADVVIDSMAELVDAFAVNKL
jgi:HAD superfamily hydrolase (TIGR01509 family)